jgi:hypothetical protein
MARVIKTKHPTFKGREIRRALRRWAGIWFPKETFDVQWHNFQMDLRDVKFHKRKR